MICETIKNHYFFFFQTVFTNCFIIQSVSFVCFVIYSILMPKTQTTLSKLIRAYAVNFFVLDLFAFPKSFFLSLGINSALFLAGRGFRKIPEVQEVHFKAFQWACETRVSSEYFLVKVTLFVAHFLVYVSLNGAYLGMVLKILFPCTS